MDKNNFATAVIEKEEYSYSLKKAIFTGTMAACVATAGFAYMNPVIVKAAKNKSVTSTPVKEDKQVAKIIKKTPLTYTEPKPYAKAFVINGVYEEANYMKKDTKVNQSYFSDKISDLSLPQKEEEIFEYTTDFEYVSDAPTKYNYSLNEVVKEYDTSRVNKNSEMYEF